jgi:hypothetical protein
LDEKTVSAVWRGFGSYISKELRNGRGVFIPKFGNFTFTSAYVDLAVNIILIIPLGYN